MKMRVALGQLVIVLITMISSEVYSCASCGSGGDDPLILYPSESRKYLLGISSVTAFRSADENGVVHADHGGVFRRTAMNFSYGQSFDTRSFFTIGLPVIVNQSIEHSATNLGDPLITTRYTVVPLNFAREYVPQVQLIAAYKFGFARSIYESVDQEQLDVFGSGYHQARLGVDLWSGNTLIQYGFAQIVAYSFARNVDGHELKPGLESRTVVSAGYTKEHWGKVVAGLSRLYVAERYDSGQKVANSSIVNNSAFFTTDYFINPISTVRLTLARQAALFNNRNTSGSDIISVAYMRSF